MFLDFKMSGSKDFGNNFKKLLVILVILFRIQYANSLHYEYNENIVQLNGTSFNQTLLEDKKNLWMVLIHKNDDSMYVLKNKNKHTFTKTNIFRTDPKFQIFKTVASNMRGKLKTGVINLDKFNPSDRLEYKILAYPSNPSIQFFSLKKTAPIEYEGIWTSADIILSAEYLVTRMESEKNSEKVLHKSQSYYSNLISNYNLTK